MKISFNPLVFLIEFLLAGTIFLSGSCDRTRNDKGYEYFPDMAHSLAYETYSPNPAMNDGHTMRTPPEGTIPWNGIPYRYLVRDTLAERPGAELMNPLEINLSTIEDGKRLYEIFCMQCHGEKGDGQGYLYTSKKYTVPPRSLVEPSVIAQNSGQIFYTISHGYGVMGQHASLIRTEDRWKIVAYVEKVLQKK